MAIAVVLAVGLVVVVVVVVVVVDMRMECAGAIHTQEPSEPSALRLLDN